VTDLAAPFPISFNTVSKHIKVLERADLIKRRKAGREYLLTFRPMPLTEVERWIEKQRAFWSASLAAIDDALRKEDQERGK
jgi:DNA-binding transcriptional ArsR family regulator